MEDDRAQHPAAAGRPPRGAPRSRSTRKPANWTSSAKVTRTPTSVMPVVAEHAVGEARHAEAGGDRASRTTVRCSERPPRTSRCDVWSCRPGGSAAPRRIRVDRDERRVEDRDREDEHRQHQRGDGRLGDLPARREPERAEREAEHLAARVAHEDERRLPRAEVEGQEAERTRRPSASERTSSSRSSWTVTASIAKKSRAIEGERPGEPVHVVEQVEGVRHPDEPEDAERRGEDVVRDDLTVSPQASATAAAPNWAASLSHAGSA